MLAVLALMFAVLAIVTMVRMSHTDRVSARSWNARVDSVRDSA